MLHLTHMMGTANEWVRRLWRQRMTAIFPPPGISLWSLFRVLKDSRVRKTSNSGTRKSARKAGTYLNLSGQRVSGTQLELIMTPNHASRVLKKGVSATGLPKRSTSVDVKVRRPAIRNFNISDVSDGTCYSGPAKMVIVGDETPGLIALLLSRELSLQFQDALWAKRELRATRAEVEEKRQDLHWKDQHALVDLIRKEKQLRRLQKKADGNGDLSESERQTIRELQDATNLGRRIREGFEDQNEELSDQLKAVQDRWEALQQSVDLVLEDVFVGCGIFPPEELSMNHQNEKSTDLVALEPPCMDTQQHNGAIELAEQKVADKRFLYEHAYRAFESHYDRHAYGYDFDFESYAKSQINRPDADLRMEYDHIYLLERSKLTRRLIEAEEELEAAIRDARAIGCYWYDYDGTSQCVDHPDDGYRESEEREIAAETDRDRGRIEQWILGQEGPFEDATSISTPHVDEWPIELKKPWDSISMIAEGAERRRIDRRARTLGHY